MGIDEVVVPRMPAGFSAWGMLAADLEHDVARTVLAPLEAPGTMERLRSDVAELSARADGMLSDQDVPAAARRTSAKLDLRYLGQEHVLEVQIGAADTVESVRERFDETHAARYGHHLVSGVEVVTIRVRGVGALPRPQLPLYSPDDGPPRPSRRAYDLARREMRDFDVVARESMPVGDWRSGPVLVTEDTSVTVVHSDQRVRPDGLGLLHVRDAA
jgi:N-methylhydantoinase A